MKKSPQEIPQPSPPALAAWGGHSFLPLRNPSQVPINDLNFSLLTAPSSWAAIEVPLQGCVFVGKGPLLWGR